MVCVCVCDMGQDGRTAAHVAAQCGHLDMFQWIVEREPSVMTATDAVRCGGVSGV